MNGAGYYWWIGAGALVLLELGTGTFYMLMIALGFVAGGLARLAGAPPAWQLLAAAVLALVATMLLRRSRIGSRAPRPDAQRNADVLLDIGAQLAIDSWHDRRARAVYRGAQWDVELAPGEPDNARWYRITALRGNCLIVCASRPATPA